MTSPESLVETIAPVMAGLSPIDAYDEWDDPEWVEENLPFSMTEYERINTWWYESGTFERVWNWLQTDLTRYCTCLSQMDSSQSAIDEVDQAGFVTVIFDWWCVNDLEEFLDRVGESYHPPDVQAWEVCLSAWWIDERPSALFEYIEAETTQFRKSISYTVQ